MEDSHNTASTNRRDSNSRRIVGQPNSLRALGEFARSASTQASPPPALPPIVPQQQQQVEHSNGGRSSRSTPKVTDHPWLTITTPYSEFNGPSSASSSIELIKSTAFNNTYYSDYHNNTPIYNTINSSNNANSKYDWRMHSLMLCRHILKRGLLDGVGSDIKVYIPAWDKTYNLHRLVLDQNPYFKLLLQGGFREADSNQVTLHFEDNPFITAESFQFVLEYLYGKIEDPLITQANVRQILATSSYFQLDVCGICVDYILKSLNHQNVVNYLLFADELMVQGSDRICDAVFTYMCREAYTMDRQILVSLPLEWLQKVIESDAFWVPSEFERYQFVQQVIMARYEAYMTNPSTFILTELDTNPNCHILSQSIYYMHMTFEQLESIQNDVHPLTRQRLVSEKVLKEALWFQVKLRSKIEAASERDTKLNMTISAPVLAATPIQRNSRSTSSSYKEEGEEYEEDSNEEEEIVEQDNKAKLYPIPTDDTTTYTGESAISLASSSVSPTHGLNNKRKSTTMSSSMSPPPGTTTANLTKEVEQYSIYPPFRFSVEFADVNTLKHGMRVYSDTVFYAGSNWNMYIQKTRSQRKGVLQLGVYLHRQSVPQQQQSHHTCQQQQHPEEAHSHQQHNNDVSSSSSSAAYRSATPSTPSNDNWSFSKYSDKRKVVKTWFKIYCPSRGPKHALTLFQSSPDNFSVLQSWGWRSTTLCADEDNVSTSNATLEVLADNTSDNMASSSVPPPLYNPQTSNQLHYLQSTYDLRTIKSALNSTINQQQQQKNSTSSGPTLKFTVVMGHV